jgi:hypothetical protein
MKRFMKGERQHRVDAQVESCFAQRLLELALRVGLHEERRSPVEHAVREAAEQLRLG